jgi:hypothetical protein
LSRGWCGLFWSRRLPEASGNYFGLNGFFKYLWIELLIFSDLLDDFFINRPENREFPRPVVSG